MTDLRQMDDEGIEEMAALVGEFGAYGWSTPLGQRVAAEQARRAEIRLCRGEMGEAHDASWYESRQTLDQWLDEQGPRCESGWTGDRCEFPLFHDGPHSN